MRDRGAVNMLGIVLSAALGLMGLVSMVFVAISDSVLTAAVTGVPIVMAGWFSYAAARHGHRKESLAAATARAREADEDRIADRRRLVRLERHFDALRAAVRDMLDVLDMHGLVHEPAAKRAIQALDAIAADDD